MSILGLSIVEFAGGVVGLGAIVYFVILGVCAVKEKARVKRIEKENDLLPNPTRCVENEKRIRSLEDGFNRFDGTLTEVKRGVDKLLDLHLK